MPSKPQREIVGCVICMAPRTVHGAKIIYQRRTCGRRECKEAFNHGAIPVSEEEKKKRRAIRQRLYLQRPYVQARTRIRHHEQKENGSERERRRRRKALEKNAPLAADARAAYRHIRATAKTCYYCGVKINRRTMEIDHIVPISKGGAHAGFNLVGTCKACNRTKWARQPHEVFGGQAEIEFTV